MQIHEITKLGKQRTDEGLLDDFKDAVGIAPKPADSRTFMQKLKGEAPNLIDFNKPENARLKAQQDAYNAYQTKKQQELETYWQKKGYKTGSAAVAADDAKRQGPSALDKTIAQVQQSPEAQTAIDNLSQKFEDDFVIATPGTEIKVTTNGGDYFKDENGQWWNDAPGKRAKITKPESINYLEKLAQQGQGKEVQSPLARQAELEKLQAKGKKSSVKESAIYEGRQTLAQKNFYAWVAPRVQGTDANKQPITFTQVLQNKQVKQRLQPLFDKMMAANNSNPPDEKTVMSAFKQFMTVAIAGLQVEKNKRGGSSDEEDQQEKGLATGDPLADKLSQEISPEGIRMILKNPEKSVQAIQNIDSINKRIRGY